VLPDASRGLRARQRAGRRIPLCPYDASRRAPSANGTAETIVGDQDSSNESDSYPEWTVGKLSMKSSENGNKRCHIKAIRIHIKMTWSSSCERVEEGKRQADCGADRGLRDVEVEDEFCPAHRQQSTKPTGSECLSVILDRDWLAVQRLSALTLVPEAAIAGRSRRCAQVFRFAPEANADCPEWDNFSPCGSDRSTPRWAPALDCGTCQGRPCLHCRAAPISINYVA